MKSNAMKWIASAAVMVALAQGAIAASSVPEGLQVASADWVQSRAPSVVGSDESAADTPLLHVDGESSGLLALVAAGVLTIFFVGQRSRRR